jgi:hypothetical protein
MSLDVQQITITKGRRSTYPFGAGDWLSLYKFLKDLTWLFLSNKAICQKVTQITKVTNDDYTVKTITITYVEKNNV